MAAQCAGTSLGHGPGRFPLTQSSLPLVAGSQACPDLAQLRQFIQQHVIILHKCSPAALGGSPRGRVFGRGGTCWNLHSLIQKLNGSFIKISKIHF